MPSVLGATQVRRTAGASPNFAGLDKINSALNKVQALQPMQQSVAAKSQMARTGAATVAPSNSGSALVSNTRNKFQQINDFGQQISDLKAKAISRRQEFDKAQQAKQQAVGTTQQNPSGLNAPRRVQSSGAAPVNYTPGASSGPRGKIVQAAASLLGTPYAWGGGGYQNRGSRGTGLGTQNVIGVDCSGLTSYAYGALGIRLPRKSNVQTTTMGHRTSISNLQPGDLVGWTAGGKVKGHVAIYIGNGMIIEAARPGTVARQRKLSNSEGAFGVHIRLPGE